MHYSDSTCRWPPRKIRAVESISEYKPFTRFAAPILEHIGICLGNTCQKNESRYCMRFHENVVNECPETLKPNAHLSNRVRVSSGSKQNTQIHTYRCGKTDADELTNSPMSDMCTSCIAR